MEITSTGITRPLDNLGRIVLPKELRASWNWDASDRLEFLLDPTSIEHVLILRKYQIHCKLCGSSVGVQSVPMRDASRSVLVCRECIKRINIVNKQLI